MPSILSTPIYQDVRNFVGDAAPQSIKRFRLSSLQTFQRMGTPVLVKRMYTAEDVASGVAVETQNWDPVYGSSNWSQDNISYGVGLASAQTQDGEWVDAADGTVIASATNPGEGYVAAPRYRGYGPGFLTYAILPDRPEDVWKLTEQGALQHIQQAMVQLPWWPQVGDNDLLITCSLNANGTIAATYERYELHMVSPITMRGQDRYGGREFPGNAGGDRFWVGQQSEMVEIPKNDIRYQVETDR